MNKSRFVLVFTVLWLCLAGLIVRVRGLGGFYFSPDDVMLLGIVDRNTFFDAWKSLAGQTNAPLMFCILFPLIKISRNELVLRGISLIPGVGLIVIFYFLGKKASGIASGIAMAGMATFGYGSILLSQVIRPYSLMVFFFSISLYFVMSYSTTPRLKYLVGYGTCMVLAATSHYPAIIPLAAVGVVFLTGMALQRKATKVIILFLLSHTPIGVAGALLFVFHVSKVLKSGYHADTKQTYLKAFLPETLTDVIRNLSGLFQYLFPPPLAPFAMVLAALGFLILWRKGRRQLAAAIVLTFLSAFALGLLNVFPFGGSRHSFYLFPMVALLIGASVQYGSESFRQLFSNVIRARINVSERAAQTLPALVGLTVLVVSTILIMNSYRKSEFLRRYHDHNGASWMEFPLKRKNYLNVVNFLDNNLTSDDVILMNQQTSHYFLWTEGRENIEYLSGTHARFSYRGVESFFVWSWKFEREDLLSDAIQGVARYVNPEGNSRIWVINMGWGDPIEDILLSVPVYRKTINGEIFREGAFACALEGRKVVEVLSRNGGEPEHKADMGLSQTVFMPGMR